MDFTWQHEQQHQHQHQQQQGQQQEAQQHQQRRGRGHWQGQRRGEGRRGEGRRGRAKELADGTLRAIEEGAYTAPSGARVEIGEAVRRAIERSEHVHFSEDLAARLAALPPREPCEQHVEVTNESTLAAAARLLREGASRVAVFNFASGKNPGGGFLGGSVAQEECIARSSALYPTLIKHAGQRDKYYMINEFKSNRGIYTSCCILSPDVPVFRSDSIEGEFLENPFVCTIITVPAPNAGVLRRHTSATDPQATQAMNDAISAAIRDRIERVLSLALLDGADALVLGAFGCGVFRNDPREVAGVFQELLASKFANRFSRVTFAILCRDEATDRNIAAFRLAFP
mmetsp:Transcript_8884/g.20659  ORF Transcript_8884/g.20659 Transcript_8884/m.20659 type:complete len:343 (-) Transcript_8884:82-1110(-)